MQVYGTICVTSILKGYAVIPIDLEVKVRNQVCPLSKNNKDIWREGIMWLDDEDSELCNRESQMGLNSFAKTLQELFYKQNNALLSSYVLLYSLHVLLYK